VDLDMTSSYRPSLAILALCAVACGNNASTDGAADEVRLDAGGSSADGSTGPLHEPDAAADGDASSASDDAGSSAADDAGDGASADPPWIPPPALANLNFNDRVLSAAHAGDAWYVGGAFTLAELVPAQRLVAVDMAGHPSGCSVESGFDDRVEEVVHVGNALYAVGEFLSYRGQPARHIAKIDATTCALDTTFSPPASGGFDADVHSVATNGSALYAVGLFTSYRGQPARYIAKLDPVTGALDETFSPPAQNGFDAPAHAVLATGSDVYVGGEFTDYRGVAGAANRLARLSASSGALLPSFGPPGATANGFDAVVVALAMSGADLYVGGQFASYRGVFGSARGVAKIDTEDGTLDTVFSPPGAANNGFERAVNTLALAGGALFVGGAFDSYRGVPDAAHRIAKLDAQSGALDTVFSPPGANGFEGNITSIRAVGSSLLVGGAPLGGYRGPEDLTTGIAKLDAATGALDAAFLTPPGHDHAGFRVDAGMRTAHVVGDTLWIAGDFTHLGGKSARGLARFSDSDGSLDRSFSPPALNGFDGEVYALTASDDALYVGGRFTAYRGVAGSASRLAKLDLRTGEQDVTFSPSGTAANGFDGEVQALAVRAGSLYAAGSFYGYRGVEDSAHCLAKLDAQTGALDTAFSPPGADANGFESDAYALAFHGSSLFVGGSFDSYRGGMGNALRIAKLDATSGALDTTFSPPAQNGFDSDVYTLDVAGDALFVGGSMSAYRDVTGLGHIAKLDATSGALDATFSAPGAQAGFDDDVRSLVVSGGSVYAVGGFLGYRGVPDSALHLAKLDAVSGALDEAFTPRGPSDAYFYAQVVTAFQSAIFVGGSFSQCSEAGCSKNALRVNRDSRQPE
jgi:Domain of unknown function (DUF5122) beta-propeller